MKFKVKASQEPLQWQPLEPNTEEQHVPMLHKIVLLHNILCNSGHGYSRF